VSSLNPLARGLSAPLVQGASPLDELAGRSVLLAGLVEAASRRRDVREVRARIVLLLFALRCPLGARPSKPWYVPGAVARLGAEGLLRAWAGFYGEGAPCLRSMRSHLGALEQSGILQRSPGDWLPVRRNPAHRERRPRWPDTFHLLDGEAATEFWAGPGARLLEQHPAARHSPEVWRRLFAGWRTKPVQHQLAFEGVLARPKPPPPRAAANHGELEAVRAAGVELARALRSAAGPFEVFGALAAAGAGLRGPGTFKAAAGWKRLRLAGAMLARALVRGDRVRNAGGWVWRAFACADAQELERAHGWLHGPETREGTT
jgi:hypothetical protein